MAKCEVTVECKPQLTVDNKTADLCLGLLELYCNTNGKTILPRHCVTSEGDKILELHLIKDEKAEVKKNNG